MNRSFDPYRKWLGIPTEEQPPHYYRLLGIEPFESDTDVIVNAADARMTHLKTFQSGEYGELSQRLLNEIAAAQICLLNPEKKTLYDEQLRRQLRARPATGVSALVAPPPPALSPPRQPPPAPPPLQTPGGPVDTSIKPAPLSSHLRRQRRRPWTVVVMVAAVLLAFGVLFGVMVFLLKG